MTALRTVNDIYKATGLQTLYAICMEASSNLLQKDPDGFPRYFCGWAAKRYPNVAVAVEQIERPRGYGYAREEPEVRIEDLPSAVFFITGMTFDQLQEFGRDYEAAVFCVPGWDDNEIYVLGIQDESSFLSSSVSPG